MARKIILQKISKDTANLNNNRDRLRLVWVNNCELIKKTKTLILNRQKFFNKTKKNLKLIQKIIN